MAENAGRIEYDFVADTTGVLKAESVVDKSTTNMANDFKKVDTSVKTLNAQVSKTAQGVRRARPDMQNMSYQLQDMAVQAQMGTSAFVIMAQQLPQMLVGMGAWAGAIGVAITVLGLMATTLIDTTTDLEKMEKAIEQVKAVITIGAGGVANYSDELKKLSTISKEITQIKLNTALAQQQQALKLTGKAAKQAYDDATPFLNLNWDNYKNKQEAVIDNIIDDKELKKLGRASPLIDNAVNAVYGLDDAMKSIKAGNTDAAIGRITSSLDLLSRSAAVNTKEGEELITKLTSIVEQYKLGKLRADELKKAVEGTSDAFKGNAEALQDYLDAIHISNTELQGNARAAEKLRLEKAGLENQEVKTALAAWDYNQTLIQQKKATEEAVSADERKAASLAKINTELDAYFDKESKQSTAKNEKEKNQAENFAQGIVDRGISEPERFALELEKLEELRREGLLSQQLYDQAIVASVKNRSAQMEKANEQNLQSQRLFTDSQGQLLGSLGNLFGAYADNMEVQDRESFEKKKKFQTAQALINTAMAISNALAAAPPPINFALAAASGAMGAIQVAAIQGQQYSGGRQYGGPVSNGMYRVNETGVPEIYSHGGKDYLMNTKNANIKPLEQGGGGGGSMQVIVNNNTPYEVYVTQDQAANIANVQIGREAGKMAKGQGSMFKAVRSSTNAKGNARN